MALSFFGRNKKKNKNRNTGYAPIDENLIQEENPLLVNRPSHKANAQDIKKKTGRQQVVQMCEEIIDASRELEDTRSEYQSVLEELKDIRLFEQMPAKDKEPILETAKQITLLESTRRKLLNSERNLSEEQFEKMADEEASIPRMVNRLKSNETYLDAIKKDMHFLEGEKMEWTILKQDLQKTQKTLRILTYLLIVVFSLAVFLLVVLRMYTKYDVMLMLLIVGLITTILAAYILFKYQDTNREIKKCEVNRNQAISLENHVKLKYVNIKNAVDYTCEKYQVHNSYELTYQYEQYMKSVKEQEHFKQNSEDLEFYHHKLERLLAEQKIKEITLWPHYAGALVYEDEMKKVKSDLESRRHKLRSQMELQAKSIARLKQNIAMASRNMGEVTLQVDQILKKLDELTQ